MNIFSNITVWFKNIPHKIYDILYPDLRSNKSWKFVEGNKKPCVICNKVRARVMRCEGTETIKEGEVNCIPCYLKDKSIESKVILTKRKLRSWIAGLTSLILILILIIIYLMIPQRLERNKLYRDTLVEYFYSRIDKTISKSTLEIQIDTILDKFLFPELGISLDKNESNFNPAAISRTGAKGTHQIINGWEKYLKEKGIIKNDVRDLHDPRTGCLAGDAIFRYHFYKAKKNLPFTLRDYVGAKEQPRQVQYIKDVIFTLGIISFIKMSTEQKGFKKEDIHTLLDFDKQQTKK